LKIGEEKVPFLPEKDIPHEIPGALDLPTATTTRATTTTTTTTTSTTTPSPIMNTTSVTPIHPSPTSTAAPQSLPTGTPPARASTQSSPFPEPVIKQLVELGFTRQQVIEALYHAGGNPDIAAGYLTFGGF